MKILFAIIFFVGLTSAQLNSTSCLYRKNGVIWNIGGLTKETGDYKVQHTDNTQTISFNICKQISEICHEQKSYATLTTGSDCRPLTNSNNSPEVTEDDQEDLILNYEYTGDLSCTYDPSKKHSFELSLLCNDDDLEPVFSENIENPCKISIAWKHSKACPWIKANALWNYFNKYRVYLAPSVIILGLFFFLLGGHFSKTSVFLITFSTVVFTILLITYGFILSYKTPEWVGWIILAASVFLGLLVAFFTSTFIKTGIFLIGAWAGGMVGACLFQSIVNHIDSNEYTLWACIGILALIGGVLSLKFFIYVLGIGTTFIGAFLVVRGVAFYAGGYPNEFELHNEIQAGDIENVPYTVYVYIVAIFGASVLGVFLKHKKFKILSHDDDNEGYFSLNR